jgi:hypothetical protein
VPRKVRTNKRRVGAEINDTQRAWLNGEWLLLGSAHASRSVEDTMEALSLIANVGSKSEALWLAHGDPEKFFWRPKMKHPISMEDLANHETCWLESGEAGADLYGAESYFIWKHYSEDAKQTLWDDFGDKENYKWNADLRRPIPIDADENDAINSFLTSGPFNIAANDTQRLARP